MVAVQSHHPGNEIMCFELRSVELQEGSFHLKGGVIEGNKIIGMLNGFPD